MEKFQQLARHWELKIKSGEVARGDFLPGENTLSEQFAMSRGTVRKGLNRLVEQGLLSVVAGRGYRVGIEDCPARSHLIGGVYAGERLYLPTNFVPFTLSQENTQVVEKYDSNLIFSNSEDDIEQEKRCIERLLKRNIDGLLIMPAYTGGAWRSSARDNGNYHYFRMLYSSGLPLVLMDRALHEAGLPAVISDDFAGGALLAEYFINRNFKRIIFFDSDDSVMGLRRFRGYESVMLKHGLTPERIDRDPCYTDTFDDVLRKLRGKLPAIDSDTVFLTSPFTIAALNQHFRRGENRFRIEWGGYDIPAKDLEQPCESYPWIRRPIREIGRLAAEKLLRLIAGDRSADTVEMLPPELVL